MSISVKPWQAIAFVIGLLALNGVIAGVVTHYANQDIAAARQAQAADHALMLAAIAEKDKAKALAKADSDRADALETKAKAQGQRVAVLEGRLAALGKPKPVTLPSAAPEDTQALAQAFTAIGFPPVGVGGDPHGNLLLFDKLVGRPLWAAAKDGKEYPALLDRFNFLAAAHDEQKAQLVTTEEALKMRGEEADTLKVAVVHAEEAISASQAETTATKQEVKATQKLVSAEKRKKWTWAGVAAVLGYLAAGL
jgi:hypothetical protein